MVLRLNPCCQIFYFFTSVLLFSSNAWRENAGAYDDEEAAAHTYDLAALKYWGPDTILNFPVRIS